MFLIRAFDMSEEVSSKVGFAFSKNGLKFQDLQFGSKKNYMIFLIMFYDFRFGQFDFSYHTFDIPLP